MYGTNTDPKTFADAQDESRNWNYICDLTKKYDPGGYPNYSYATVIAKGTSNTTIDLNEFECDIYTTNGRVFNPPIAANINIEGYESVTRSTEPGLLIDGTDNGYTWSNTAINMYNTLFTFSIDGITSIDKITLKGTIVPDDLIIMTHNLHDNPAKEDIENENHNVKCIYSDTTMFDGETEHFTYTRIIQAPVEPVVEPVERIVLTGGDWAGSYDYLYMETTEGRYLYGLVSIGATARFQNSTRWDIEYDPNGSKFYDVGGKHPYTWGNDDTGTNLSDFPTRSNMPIHYWYDPDGNFNFQFDNPYYVA